MSSTNGGNGNISIASIANITIGAPAPRRVACLKVSNTLAVATNETLRGIGVGGEGMQALAKVSDFARAKPAPPLPSTLRAGIATGAGYSTN
ncbi:hypothetical protein GCM10007863_43190 [Dyella mobilis]|nr:hypothetical protein GCM10007863_43190 [Dyella mobilis]